MAEVIIKVVAATPDGLSHLKDFKSTVYNLSIQSDHIISNHYYHLRIEARSNNPGETLSSLMP